MKRHFRLSVLLLIVLALLTVPAAAQDEPFGSGTIDENAPNVQFTVDLQAGESLTAYTEATSGDLDTILSLIDPAGIVVQDNDDFPEMGLNSAVVYTALESGTYLLKVSAYGSTSGDFDLYVIIGEATATPAESFAALTRIEEGELEEGDTQEYTFEAQEGSAIVVQTQTQSGDLDPLLTLQDPDGETVAENDDANLGQNLDSLIYVEAQTSGEYTVSVGTYSGSGEYTLSISVEQETDANSMIYLGEVDAGETAEFALPLEDGQTVVITTQSLRGSMDTVLTLLNSEGDEIQTNDDLNPDVGNFNSLIIYTADEGGAYTLNVANYYDNLPGEFMITVVNSETGDQAPTVSNETQVEQGEIRDGDDSETFTFDLNEGQTALVQTEAQDDSLDTILEVFDPSGESLGYNDDINTGGGIYNSGIAFTAEVSGEYTAEVSSYGGSTGEFELTITTGGTELIQQLESQKRVQLSGAVVTLETEHFLIHYTTEGEDAADEDFVALTAEYAEEAYRVQIEEMGWAAPPPDNGAGGDDRIDVYLSDVFGGAESVYGYAIPEPPGGDNPNTQVRERRAMPGYLVVDNDFDSDFPPGETAEGYLHTTIAHEFNHVVQFGYDTDEPANWYFESIATWMEPTVAGDDEEATIYVGNIYSQPDVCFGSKDGGLVYGNYLFVQSLAAAHGDQVVRELWENAVEEDGFDALELTLERYDDTIPLAFGRFYVQNLLLDYPYAERVDATVNVTETIDEEGEFDAGRGGAQELGANYYAVDLRDGAYEATLDGGDLALWGVGVNGDSADVYDLGDGGVFETGGYDYYYLIVVNLDYDENVDDCEAADYTLNIEGVSDEAGAPAYTANAENFEEAR